MIYLILLLQSSLALIEIDHQKSMRIDPDQSPFAFHIQKNFNLVMVQWYDTNLTISIEDEAHTTKTITQLDGYSIFSFTNNATINMSFLSPTSFFVTEGPYLLKHGKGNNTFTISNECSVIALYRNTYADYIFSIYGYYNIYGQVIRTCDSSISLYYHKEEEEASRYSYKKITKGTNDINIENATGPCKIIRESITDNMTIYGFGLAQNTCENPTIKATHITEDKKDSENYLQYDSNMAYGGNGEGVKKIKSLISEIEPKPLYRYLFNLNNLSSEYKFGFVYSYSDTFYKEIQGNEIITPETYIKLYLLYSPMPNNYPSWIKNINYDSEIKYYNITEDDLSGYIIEFYIDIQCTISSSEYKVYVKVNETYIEVNNTHYKETQRYPFSINIYMVSPFCEDYTLINTFNATHDYYHVDKIDEIPQVCQPKPKTICICKEEDNSCEECTKDLDGIIKKYPTINEDPGKYYDIRVFENITISSDIFNIYHNISVDQKYQVVVNNVSFVNENENNSFICDYLIFSSLDNIIIKPKTSILNISVPSVEEGIPFTLEINDLVHLKPFNSESKKLNYSNITVIGKGDLNVYKYPIKYITVSNDSKINLIEGLHVICNYNRKGSNCIYNEKDNFLVLKNTNSLTKNIEFRPNTLIYYYIETFDNDAVFDIDQIYHSNLYIIRQKTSELQLLSDNKLILNSSNIMTFSNEKVILDGGTGGVLLRNVDADDFVVEYIDNLTIVQEGNITSNSKTILINTPNHDSKVIFNKSFNLQDQKLSFISEVPTEIVFTSTNKSMTMEDLKEFIDFDVNTTIKLELVEDNTGPDDKNPNGNNNNKDPDDKNKGLSGGEIAGIVVGVIAAVAIVAVIIFFVIKKKRNNDSNQEGMEV